MIFYLKSKLNTVVFDGLEIKDIGVIEVKNQTIHLKQLQMKTMAAQMQATMRYHAKNKSTATIDFDFALVDIDIAKLVQLMPVLDTLLPMAKSLEGHVNYRMQDRAT